MRSLQPSRFRTGTTFSSFLDRDIYSRCTMLLTSSHGNVCLRCALRLRILSLQQRRLRSTVQTVEQQQQHSDSIIRYTTRREGAERKVRYYAKDGSGDALSRYTENKRDDNTVVRKFFRKTNLKDWGLDPESIAKRKKNNFRDALLSRLQFIKDEVKHAPILQQVAQDQRELGGKRQESFTTLWKGFTQKILHSGEPHLPFIKGQDEAMTSLWEDLQAAWNIRGTNGLDDRIKYAFYGHVTNSRFTESDIKNQQTLADLRYPTEWFPATRALTRTIHLHVGPTNSGKTFQALQRLEQAKKGVYAGPLRLLAHEVYSRMNAKGKPCYLITGEERRMAEGLGSEHYMAACTVEMVPLNKALDVAVIDEIQMIGNAERGWAWTQALLGVKAHEVHLCGEERTVPLIKELCASVGEKLEVHRYTRLSPLQMADGALDGNLGELRKGDCVVSFSVMGIHALRRQIEKATGRKVATVYGSLPPETRAQQARLFNDPDNDYDYLVASDAVGMGLNLAIKRIIFEASSKFDGIQRRTLSIADVKQIGGRAGRFRTAAQASEAPVSQQELAAAKGEPSAGDARGRPWQQDEIPENVGLVTTLESFDFPIVQAAMESEPEPIQTAGLFPPAPVLERFASYFPPGTPFSYMLTRLHELSQVHKRFHLCGLKDQVWIADLIEPVSGLTWTDRNTFCAAPAAKADNDLWRDLMPAFARSVAEQSACSIADIKELPLETLEAEVSPSREYLRELERLHKGIVTYLWLSYRFQGIFNTRALAFHVKSLVEEKIEYVLGQFSFSEMQRKKLAARREKEIMESLLAAQQSPQQDIEGTDKPNKDYFDSAVAAADKYSDNEADGRDAAINTARLADEDLDQALNKNNQDQELSAAIDGHTPVAVIAGALEDQTSLTGVDDRFGREEDLGIEELQVEVERVQHKSHVDDTTMVDKITRNTGGVFRKPSEAIRENL